MLHGCAPPAACCPLPCPATLPALLGPPPPPPPLLHLLPARGRGCEDGRGRRTSCDPLASSGGGGTTASPARTHASRTPPTRTSPAGTTTSTPWTLTASSSRPPSPPWSSPPSTRCCTPCCPWCAPAAAAPRAAARCTPCRTPCCPWCAGGACLLLRCCCRAAAAPDAAGGGQPPARLALPNPERRPPARPPARPLTRLPRPPPLPAPQSWASPLLGGGVAGYVLYDTTHWALHSGRADWLFTRTLKSSHMEHHYVRRWGRGGAGEGRTLVDCGGAQLGRQCVAGGGSKANPSLCALRLMTRCSHLSLSITDVRLALACCPADGRRGGPLN